MLVAVGVREDVEDGRVELGQDPLVLLLVVRLPPLSSPLSLPVTTFFFFFSASSSSASTSTSTTAITGVPIAIATDIAIAGFGGLLLTGLRHHRLVVVLLLTNHGGGKW